MQDILKVGVEVSTACVFIHAQKLKRHVQKLFVNGLAIV